MSGQRVVAVGLLTEQDLGLLGDAFTRVWSVEDSPSFCGLLEAIDDADRRIWRSRDRVGPPGRSDL